MLSTAYRLRLEGICKKIANNEQVDLSDMIWAEKLAKAHTTARDWLNKARRQSKGIEEGSIDDFMNKMGLGDPDPSNHQKKISGADEIVDWFKKTNLMIGGNVTNDFLDNLAAQQYRKAHRDNIKALQREIEELKAEIVVLKASKNEY